MSQNSCVVSISLALLLLLFSIFLLSSTFFVFDFGNNNNNNNNNFALGFESTPLNSTSSGPSNNTSTNSPLAANAGTNRTVNENSTVILVGAASDPDPSAKLTYSWKQIAGPSVKLADNDTANPTFMSPSSLRSDIQLKFLLVAKDNRGAVSKPAIVTITVKHINRPPVAIPGQNQIVNPGDVVSLDGSKSKDPDGDPITYLWTQTSGPAVKLDSASSSIATFTAPSNISSNTSLIFKLIVKDNKNAASEATTVKVTDKYVPPPNQPPVANAGQNQTVNSGDMVTLHGSGSRDPDGNITSYTWMQTAGPPVALNSNGANTANPTFTSPSVSNDTDLKFSLIVKDNKGAASVPAVVTIIVKHLNHPPVANAGQNQTVNTGYVVSLDGSGSRDPDGDPIRYSWVQTAGPSVNLTGADKPIATFTAPSNISSDTDLAFKLTVTDDKNASSTNTVKVTDKYVPPPNQPPVANAGSDQTVNASDSVTLDGSGSRDPDGNITSYTWMQTAGPPVTLNGVDTMTASFTAPTLSNETTLKFSLTVKDDKGATNNNPATVMVTVKAAPAPPTSTAPAGNMTSAAPSVGNATYGNMTSSSNPLARLFGGNMTSPASNNQTNISSSDVFTLNIRGTTLFNLGDYNGAIQYYDKALAIDPNNKVALDNKGTALVNLGRYTEAIPYLDKALAIDPNYKEALNEKGVALGNQGYNAEAITYYDKALAIDPNYKQALASKGTALNNLGRYTEAISYLDKALDIDPNNKETLSEKGVALGNQGYNAEAITYYDKALAIDPNYKQALASKGAALNNLGRYTEAIPYLDKALAIDPNYKETLNNKGYSLNNLGRYTEAIPYLDKALAIDPNYQPAINNKNYALAHQGNSGNR